MEKMAPSFSRGARMKANDNLAGKRVQCPKCKGPIVVPQAAAPAAPAEDLFADVGGPAGDPLAAPAPSQSAAPLAQRKRAANAGSKRTPGKSGGGGKSSGTLDVSSSKLRVIVVS